MTNHAKERALERYNKELGDNDLAQMVECIKKGEILFLGRSSQNKNMKFCYVKYNHIPYKVLYYNNNKGKGHKTKIITVYPFDWKEYNEALELEKQRQIERAIYLLKKEGYIVYKRKKKCT